MEIVVFIAALVIAGLSIRNVELREEIYFLRYGDLSSEVPTIHSKPFDWAEDAEYLND